MLRNCVVDFVEICNVYVRQMIIKAAKRIFNSDMICRSYSDLNFGVTFLEHSVGLICHGLGLDWSWSWSGLGTQIIAPAMAINRWQTENYTHK